MVNSNFQHHEDVHKALVNIVGPENVTREKCDLICYEKDFSLISTSLEYMPDYVIHLKTTEQASEVVKLANKYKMPIVPRGGGTNQWGGSIPVKGGIVLDMRKMNSILSVDEENRTVTVQGGAVIRDVVNHLKKRGFFVADKPDSWFAATVSARTQTNGIGYYNLRYGRFVDQVLCLEVVLPTGEVIKTGPSGVYDPSSGYDLTRLFSNAEGTLGIITEVTLRIHRLPEHRVVELIEFPTYEKLIETVMAIRDSGLVPETIETMDGTCYNSYVQGTYAELYKEPPPEVPRDMGAMIAAYAGTRKWVEAQVELAHELYQKFGGKPASNRMQEALTVSKETHPYNPFPRNAALAGKPGKYVFDGTVPLNRTADVFRAYLKLVDKYEVEPFGIETVNCAPDFHSAICARIHVDESDEAEIEAARKLEDEMQRYVIGIGGGIGGCGGIGMMRVRYAEAQHGPALEVMKKIKRLLDPNNIMNPGKKFE